MFDNDDNIQLSPIESKPFYIDRYRRVLKKSYEKMKRGEISVPNLLSYEEYDLSNSTNETSKWSFSMKDLKKMYDFRETDSLIEKLQFTKIES